MPEIKITRTSSSDPEPKTTVYTVTEEELKQIQEFFKKLKKKKKEILDKIEKQRNNRENF